MGCLSGTGDCSIDYHRAGFVPDLESAYYILTWFTWGLISVVVAGRGVFDLDQLGVSVRPRLTGATAAGGYQRYPLAGQRHTSRL
jgi:hypothetical protein